MKLSYYQPPPPVTGISFQWTKTPTLALNKQERFPCIMLQKPHVQKMELAHKAECIGYIKPKGDCKMWKWPNLQLQTTLTSVYGTNYTVYDKHELCALNTNTRKLLTLTAQITLRKDHTVIITWLITVQILKPFKQPSRQSWFQLQFTQHPIISGADNYLWFKT